LIIANAVVFSTPSVGPSEKTSLGIILVVLLSFVLCLSFFTIAQKLRLNLLSPRTAKQATHNLSSVEAAFQSPGQILENATKSLKGMSQEQHSMLFKDSSARDLTELTKLCREKIGVENLKFLLALMETHPIQASTELKTVLQASEE
jgi:hypothetical protein